MDSENPEDFLQFLPDGNVVPAAGLNPADRHRAEETIRIFNLNGSSPRPSFHLAPVVGTPTTGGGASGAVCADGQ